jgi:hypothetical protein
MTVPALLGRVLHPNITGVKTDWIFVVDYGGGIVFGLQTVRLSMQLEDKDWIRHTTMTSCFLSWSSVGFQ